MVNEPLNSAAPGMKTLLSLAAAALCDSGVVAADPATSTNSFPVSITVDAAKPLGELTPIWRMFGADEPNYATMKNGRKLLGELGALRPKEVYFRAHNLLCSGDGTPALKWGSTGVYSEDANGQPRYDWKILDHIFDTYLTNGVRPFAQIGFMPEALSTHPQPYQHRWTPQARYEEIMTGWAYPPKVTSGGANWCGNGSSMRWNATAKRKWRRGIGRCGTKRTVIIGGPSRKSFTSCTITPLMACAAPYPRRE